ncbi:MAG: hypothetical protein GX036_10845 [Firmicutes bacterium]|nr:hypothetical protein [Bacillota bacterium]
MILLGGTLFFNPGIGEDLLPSGSLQEFFASRQDADWKTYRRALQRVTAFFSFFQKQPAVETGESQRVPGEPAGDDGFAGFQREIFAEKDKLTAETLKRLEEALRLEIEAKLRQEKKRLQQMAEEAIGKKQEEYAEKLAVHHREIEEKHKARLADLRFRLQLPDLSAEEKKRIEEEIRVVEQQITREIKAKTGELQAELAVFAKGQQAAVDEQLDEYRRRLWREGRAWLRQEAERLGRDYQ